MNKLPPDVKLTIVSDSCHSGGLIENTKEQIGESFQSSGEGYENDEDESEYPGNAEDGRYGKDGIQIKNKSLPLDILLDMLKQKSRKDDVRVGNIRTTLFDMFRDDASSTVKKFVRSLMGGDNNERGGGGFIGLVGSVATQIVKQIVEDEPIADNRYANYNSDDRSLKGGDNNEQGGGFMGWVGSLATQSDNQIFEEEPSEDSELVRGNDMGILVSGCQTSETSIDVNSGDGSDSYGALSNAIQTIIESAPPDEPITNRQLVTQVRELLAAQGFTQKPGLYCTDANADAPFIC